MQKTNINQGIRNLKNWKDKGILTFDNPIQRASQQWSLLQKSLLIHSLIGGYPVPACYFLKSKDKNESTVYDCLDAKQRLTSIFDFIEEDGYALHSATPSVKYEGFEYDLADMKFSDLPEELKDEILGYRFTIYQLEDCTDEEIEEIFARLNNSTPLSPIQKCRSVMGSDLARWTKELCNSEFYLHSVGLTLAQARREADLETLLQAMMLLDSRQDGYDDWKAISTAEVTKYCKHIRGNYDDDKRLMLMEIIEYLSKAFTQKHKFLKKSNIPTIIVLAKVALEQEIAPDQFKVFVDSFSNSICPAYEMNTGAGNVKRTKTEGRLSAIANAFADYFELKGVNILEVEVDIDSLTEKAVAENSTEDEEAAENIEVDSDEASVEGDSEEEAETSLGVSEEGVTDGEEDSNLPVEN